MKSDSLDCTKLDVSLPYFYLLFAVMEPELRVKELGK